MTVACGMIGCPDWVSILGLCPAMCETWTAKVKVAPVDDVAVQDDNNNTAVDVSEGSVAQTVGNPSSTHTTERRNEVRTSDNP